MVTFLIILGILVAGAGVYYYFYKTGKINDRDGDYIPDEVEDAVEDVKEELAEAGAKVKKTVKTVKRRAKRVKEELADVGDAIKEVGNDGHFFGIQHTQDRYSDAFYQPFLSDWRNFEAWEAAGGVWTAERAHKKYKTILNEFEAPYIDDSIKEELEDFVARRKAEGGAPTDY